MLVTSLDRFLNSSVLPEAIREFLVVFLALFTAYVGLADDKMVDSFWWTID